MSRSKDTDRGGIGGGSPADSIRSSTSDEDLLRLWDELKPQTPSTEFKARVAKLTESLQGQARTDEFLVALLAEAHADLGASIAQLRERCHLTRATLRQRLRVDGAVLYELESNALFPETLPEVFWRGFAAAVDCRTEILAELIASYDRTKITVSGMAAARAAPGMSHDQRSAFLAEEGDVQADLDARRHALVDALRRST